MVELKLDSDMLRDRAIIDYHIECANYVANTITSVLNKGVAYYDDDMPAIDGYIDSVDVDMVLNDNLYGCNGPDWTYDSFAPSVYCECEPDGKDTLDIMVVTDRGYLPSYITHIYVDVVSECIDARDDYGNITDLLTLYTIK